MPELSKRLAYVRFDKGAYLLEVLEARTGNVRGGILLDTGKGSFRVSGASAVGGWLVVTDNANRTLLYSIATGEQKGKLFGRRPVVSSAGGLLCVENERGQLSLYDLATLRKRDQFVFTSPISMVQFALDGKRLFVLTSGQTAYVLDVSTSARASAATNP